MELGLKGRRFVVAGGSRGIGRAIALAFVAEGAAYFPAAAAALGGIDSLINNASGFGRSDDEESWEVSLSVDLPATVRGSREALPSW